MNWRGGLRLTDRSRLFARIVNLFDKRYADRADFAFGSYRYFPSMPIQGYLGVELERCSLTVNGTGSFRALSWRQSLYRRAES